MSTSDPPAGSQPPVDPPYHSLYRRFRPQRFSEVRGQEHVTRALRNSVRDGRVAHAYLFSGPRGTGKTSTARILAMALNCEHQTDGEPDGTCSSCVEIRRGASVDVQELDAASNRRLDEIRDLLARVAWGTRGRWKVYIIDEVHQLTSDAASALLKTLEEPPGHVVFVLATTDPQKVLPTIRSRTIPFDFHLLPAEVLVELVRDINERAQLGLAKEALDQVVRRGHGSARDTLTMLDQAAAGGGGEDSADDIYAIGEGLAERDTGVVLTAVARAVTAGGDARRLAADLLEHLRNGFLASVAPRLVLLDEAAVAGLAAQARRMGLAALVRAMEVLGEALAEMRDSVDPRITLEVALVRLSRPDADVSPAALLERIERLERAGRSDPRSLADAADPSGGRGSHDTVSHRESSSLPAPPPMPTRATPSGAERPSPPLVTTEAAPAPAARASAPPAPAARASAPPAPAAGASALPASAPHPTGARASSPLATAAVPSTPLPPSPPTTAGTGPPSHTAAVSQSSSNPPATATRLASPTTGAPSPSTPPVLPSRTTSASPDRPSERRLPSRDELTKAWGDGVLATLSARAKGYLGSGRFVRVDPDGAVFALPNQGMVARSQVLRAEAEAALASRFGLPIPIKLVAEAAVHVEPPPAADPVDEVISRRDLEELPDADVAVVSPEQRLLEMFPGAEEVSHER